MSMAAARYSSRAALDFAGAAAPEVALGTLSSSSRIISLVPARSTGPGTYLRITPLLCMQIH